MTQTIVSTKHSVAIATFSMEKIMRNFIYAASLAILPFSAQAASVIDNGIISLGVDDLGQLNFAGIGLKYLPNNHESTIQGCPCEGWGVGIGETMQSGYANNATGIDGLTLQSFTGTSSSAVSIVTVNGTDLRVTHNFAPATETSNLYRVAVTIENNGTTDIADLRYTRTFDWDVDPTPFSEYVTIQGTTTTPSVLYADDNGFSNSNPFADRTAILFMGDAIDQGPADHGSNFDFGFGALLAGDSYTFDIFYGAASTEVEILAALGEVGAEVYSLGQSSGDPLGLGTDGFGNPTTTFAFGFRGVGGKVIVPDPTPSTVPVPASGLLLLAGLGAFGVRRKKKART